ncbi:PTS system mannose/fructose/sorbose family IID component [Thermoanaerobacterium thermosaccharolyticum DSM 571]|uniref:PTS system mannose/fructose/sorbose family IID component n=1 Tax=Thermoanaerobacterium thermosaccharolyticum (strain ATCC 7956 / DSM 571 / NCIMB 9385 / NCA 3814 / NCTC 13789 / WDCM 00135 / 2032) TaxID=580327 RepID=D9TTF2_THETC|nr:PTS system mannose/fructose/sorbose family transporter subunit IID [Thermoanaerobacterium thermosaccharolyticum]ADL69928.1 PTS system mannose/fructose/sorbose family IID component [Thermoanaerobacterium thermosaccharolyticum DSM 571]
MEQIETKNNVDSTQTDDTSKKITKKDLLLSWFRWWYANEIPHTYDRMVAPSLLFGLMPILRKIYKKSEDLKEAYKRHLLFFNTQAIWGGGTILGITASLEEERAKKLNEGKAEEALDPEIINSTKVGLMGPLAGIGDAIDSGTVQYILIAIFLPWAKSGSALGALVPWILFVALTFAYGFYFTQLGYRLGRTAVAEIVSGTRIRKIIDGLSVLGTFMMGIMAALYVQVSTPLKWTISGKQFVLQDILDKILPGLLPLLTVLLVYWYFSKKGLKIVQVLLGLIVIFVVLGFIGLL